MKIKIGILFGGASRERDWSLRSAQHIYDQLDKQLFEAIPIFVDIHQSLFVITVQQLFEPGISMLWEHTAVLPNSEFLISQESFGFQTELEQSVMFRKMGTRITPNDLPHHINLAFLNFGSQDAVAMSLYSEFEKLRIPFTGWSAKTYPLFQDKNNYYLALKNKGTQVPDFLLIEKETLSEKTQLIVESKLFPARISPNRQGFLYGDVRIDSNTPLEVLEESVQKSSFEQQIPLKSWLEQSPYERKEYLRFITDLIDGLGFPLQVSYVDQELVFEHPANFEEWLSNLNDSETESKLFLRSTLPHQGLFLESLTEGAPFECLVIKQKSGNPFALHPLPRDKQESDLGFTQMELQEIRIRCQELFEELDLGPCCILSGVRKEDGELVFVAEHQAVSWEADSTLIRHLAYLDWHISDFLNYFIQQSLKERIKDNPSDLSLSGLLSHLQHQQTTATENPVENKPHIALMLSSEAIHNPLEKSSAHFLWEELNGLGKYAVSAYEWGFAEIKTLSMADLLIEGHRQDALMDTPLFQEIMEEVQGLDYRKGLGAIRSIEISAFKADFAFLIGHFSAEQVRLLREQGVNMQLPNEEILSRADNAFTVLEALEKNGFSTVPQLLLHKEWFAKGVEGFVNKVEQRFPYPLFARPIDQTGRKFQHLIQKRADLLAYAQLIFRPLDTHAIAARQQLQIAQDLAFPIAQQFMVCPLMDSPTVKTYTLKTGVLLAKGETGEAFLEVLPSSSWEDGQWVCPPSFGRSEKELLNIEKGIKREIERALRILNFWTNCEVESFLRIFEDNSFKLIFANFDTFPILVPNNCIFTQALEAGYTHAMLIDRMIESASSPKVPMAYNVSVPKMMNEQTEENPEQLPENNLSEADTAEQTEKDSFFIRIWKESKALLSASIFWRNLGAIFVSSILLFFLLTWSLGLYTFHGRSYQVEDYRGMNFEEAKRKAKANTLRAVITDSIFVIGEDPNIVKDQDPKPGSKVKKKRTVYLWVTGGKAPEILLPSLDGIDDYEAYRRELSRRGISLIIKEKRFNRKLQENTILEFFYQGAPVSIEDIKSGFKVTKGTTIECIVSKQSTNQVSLPNMVCKTFSEAQFMLESNRLLLGEVYGSRDNNSYVWKQEPPFTEGTPIPQGTRITLHLTSEKPDNCQ